MTDELVFYTSPMSRGRTVRWMLEEVGEPYRTVLIDFKATEKDAGLLAANPMGKVPTIVHGDTVVTETAAICAYLADTFPAAGLAPAVSSRERGTYYRWLFFAAGPVEAAIVDKSLGVTVPGDKEGMVGYGNLDRAVATLETALASGPYILGEQFSAADIYVGSQISFGMMFGSIEKRPAFVAYSERLNARAAAVRAREIDDALLPAEMRGMM